MHMHKHRFNLPWKLSIYMIFMCARYELAKSDSVIVTPKEQVQQVNFIKQTLNLSSLLSKQREACTGLQRLSQ